MYPREACFCATADCASRASAGGAARAWRSLSRQSARRKKFTKTCGVARISLTHIPLFSSARLAKEMGRCSTCFSCRFNEWRVKKGHRHYLEKRSAVLREALTSSQPAARGRIRAPHAALKVGDPLRVRRAARGHALWRRADPFALDGKGGDARRDARADGADRRERREEAVVGGVWGRVSSFLL